MDYKQGYVYDLMDAGGPTDVHEPYFKEAVDEMLRARKLCAIANAKMPDDASYVADLEELFGCKLDDVRILTPFICDFGNRVNFGKGVFINHSAILSASGGIEFEDGVMLAPAVRIATINHDFNERHTKYTYGKVTIKNNLPTMISSNASCRLCTMFPLSVRLKSGMDSRNSCNSALIFLYRILPCSSFDFTDFFRLSIW